MDKAPAVSSVSGPERLIADLAEAVEGRLAGKSLADPLGVLSLAARLERLSRTLAEQAAAAAISAGMSWREIGAAYGISKQAAHQRFARHARRLGQAVKGNTAKETAIADHEIGAACAHGGSPAGSRCHR